MPATGARHRNPPRARRRLDVEARRQELLRIGMELFSRRAYDEVWVEEIADRAGVSRGLLYHYFPNKRDFYVAVTRAAADEARQVSEPDPSLPLPERARASLDGFLRYAEDHSRGFLTAYRGALAGDPEVRRIVEGARRRQADRITAAVVDGEPSALLRLAAHGWVAQVQDVTARWLRAREPAREQVRDMLVEALIGTLTAATSTPTRND